MPHTQSDVEEEDAVSADGAPKEDTDEAGGDVEAEAEAEPGWRPTWVVRT